MNPNYDQALKNLQAGGLTGKALEDATKSLQGHFQQTGTPSPYMSKISPSVSAGDIGNVNTSVVPAPINNNTAQNNLAITTGSNAVTSTTPVSPSTVVPADTTGKDAWYKRMLDSVTALGTKGDVTNQLNTENSVDAKQQAVTNLTNQYNAKEAAYKKQEEEIRKNPNGGNEQFVNAQLNDLSRQKNNELADIAIQQNAALGNYNTALDIVKRKVDAQFEGIDNQIKTAQFMLQYLNNDMTDSEKLKAQAKIAADQSDRDYGHQVALAREKNKLDISLKNQAIEGDNAPLYAGLSSPTATAVRSVVNGFKSESAITNFQQVQSGYNFSKSLKDDTKNPADDQALIYSLAKVLDPNSVVREGEYATAQKYSQSWVNAYGKGVTQALAGTGFLSKTARENIKATIKSKYNTEKSGYEYTYNQYANQINNLTGRGDGTKFLRDYSNESDTGTIPSDKQSAWDEVVNGTQIPYAITPKFNFSATPWN